MKIHYFFINFSLFFNIFHLFLLIFHWNIKKQKKNNRIVALWPRAIGTTAAKSEATTTTTTAAPTHCIKTRNTFASNHVSRQTPPIPSMQRGVHATPPPPLPRRLRGSRHRFRLTAWEAWEIRGAIDSLWEYFARKITYPFITKSVSEQLPSILWPLVMLGPCLIGTAVC